MRIEITLAKVQDLSIDDLVSLNDLRLERGDLSAPYAIENALNAAKDDRLNKSDRLVHFTQALESVFHFKCSDALALKREMRCLLAEAQKR